MAQTTRTSKPIYFGPPPGVEEGEWFQGHDDLYAANVHRRRGRGISGTAAGVDSIIASGGYAADRDEGDVIVYTGEGGAAIDGHITQDQQLTGPNAGLVVNEREGLPIRFVRGLGIRGRRARGGYRYAGLYFVEEHWSSRTPQGHLMWQFRLVKGEVGVLPEDVEVEDSPGMTDLERVAARYVSTQRRVRNTRAARKVKEIYGNTCQICREPVVLDEFGSRYSEGAHIHALGEPHSGPDVVSNILCLCPNCHVKFDNGALLISDDMAVISGITRRVLGDLYIETAQHHIGLEYVQQHRSRWADRG